MCKAITELIAEGREEGRKQEQQNTIRERFRAEQAESRAEQAEKEIELLKQRLQELNIG